jgi:glyoxylase-like metal-dependent hydrolase (beta-lactamase superfamily II)
VWSQNTPQFGPPELPAVGFKRMKLGSMEIIALNDGAVRRPLGQEFVPSVPLDQVKALLASQSLPTDFIDVPYTPFLLVNGNQRYLFDTGFADNGPPTTGKLLGNLAAAGFKPEDINNVVLSHFHGDHINGLRYKNGSLVYPNARVHVPAPEHAFWTDEARIAAAPAPMQGAFAGVKRALGGLAPDQLVNLSRAAVWPLASSRWPLLATPRVTACSPCAQRVNPLPMWLTSPTCLLCLRETPIGRWYLT